MTKNMTQGNPAKLILLFTIPLLLGNFFQQLYNIADTFIVGRTIGVNALAAVGCTGSLMFFIIGFANGFTAGLSIITAQRFGAGDEQGVKYSYAAAILLSIAVTIILTIISVVMARPILEIMRTPPEIIEDAHRYIIVIFGGVGAALFFNLYSNIIRALGDSRTPLLFLVVVCIINIILDFILILLFSLGVAGAAWATITAQAVSALLCFLYIKKKLPILELNRHDWQVSKVILWEHIRVALPMGFQASIIAIGAIVVQFTLNNLGAVSVAAYTAAQKIDMVAVLPMMSFGITMATYVAQNYGAKDIQRISLGVRQCCIMSVTFSIIIGIVNFLAGHVLITLFVGADQPEVVEQAQIYLTINGLLYFVLALLFIYRYTLQGLGQSFVPTIAGIMELFMRTFAAIILSQNLGFRGACLANPLAWIGACLPLGIAYFITMKRLTRSVPMITVQPCMIQHK
ncbi:MATE family efflux transporter [Cellulosilyticum sp. I15G10I2]|uniref:MATE family efflux transporter n=1 Tax=Cellulosilyticum sp. I15G10I2 TaxID=1892843 RepID=UPI00085CC646|nr:MATE family efflux transporter [Cellulosilyticum sp. I15G10I2]